MLSLLFLATSAGFLLYKCVLWLQSRSCFMANFCSLALSSVYWNQGLNFTNFFYALVLFTTCFVAPEQIELVLRPIFVTWLCRACTGTWSCLQRGWWLQSRSCFTAYFCYLTLSSVYWNQGLNFVKFITPRFVYCVFLAPKQKLFYGYLLLLDSVERILFPGA